MQGSALTLLQPAFSAEVVDMVLYLIMREEFMVLHMVWAAFFCSVITRQTAGMVEVFASVESGRLHGRLEQEQEGGRRRQEAAA